jgi:hypothetical protein
MFNKYEEMISAFMHLLVLAGAMRHYEPARSALLACCTPRNIMNQHAVPCLHASRRGILPPLKLPLSDICSDSDMAIGVDESCDSKGRCWDATWQDAG